MMLRGQRVESGVIIPWDEMVSEDVAKGKEAAVTGEYPGRLIGRYPQLRMWCL
jgi:hypothetical protein